MAREKRTWSTLEEYEHGTVEISRQEPYRYRVRWHETESHEAHITAIGNTNGVAAARQLAIRLAERGRINDEY